MYLYKIVGYFNISSKVNFQGAGLKLNVTVTIFRKKNVVIALVTTFIYGFNITS